MELALGKYNNLEVIKKVEFGVYLKAGEEEILLPLKYVPQDTNPGDILTVFIYKDSEGRVIATTLKPYAVLDEFAYLEVKEINETGAFLDWGIAKDLLVPYREQSKKMEKGKKYVVRIYIDNITERIVASSNINKFIDNKNIEVRENDSVELMIASSTDMGFNAIINNRYMGLLYKNEVFDDIKIGEKRTGYIKKIREDNKIDLSLQKSGYELVDDTKIKVINRLKENNGFLPLSDKSTPKDISKHLKISKKAFKKAIGGLYKERLIEITDEGIKLT